MKINWTTVVAVLALLVAGAAVFLQLSAMQAPEPAAIESATVLTDLTLEDDLVVGDDASVTGDLAVTGTSSVTGVQTFTDAASFAGETIYTRSWITPTAGQTLSPSATFYTVGSTGAVSMTLGTSGVTLGQVVYLYGVDNNTVTINDTNLRSSTGNALSLGQYDIAGFIYNGVEWVEMFLLADS